MNKYAKKLADIYSSLPEDVARQLLEYAEFLEQRYPAVVTEISEPKVIPRPPNETVVAAVKRLSDTYSMLDKDKLLNETTALVTQHMLHGRDALEVIDELEDIFRQQYELMLQDNKE